MVMKCERTAVKDGEQRQHYLKMKKVIIILKININGLHRMNLVTYF